MEVVTAILSSLGSIAGAIAPNVNVDKKRQNEILKQEGVPLKKDWFSKYTTNNTKQYYTIILAIIGAILIAIVAMSVSSSKK